MTSILLFALVGCGADTVDSADTGPAPEPIHPNVPEGYEYKWNTDGCTQADGSEGANVYMLAEGATTEDGTASITETWY